MKLAFRCTGQFPVRTHTPPQKVRILDHVHLATLPKTRAHTNIAKIFLSAADPTPKIPSQITDDFTNPPAR